jgi:hypothetical protein
MAKCGITNIGGGGGIGSDELSATKKQVLKGKTYVGADTNDEIGIGELDLGVITATSPDMLTGKVGVDKNGNPVTGTIPSRGTGYHGVGSGLNTQGLYYYIGPGYYYENPTNNPWVYMTRAEVAATLGIEPWKMRGDVNVCGVQGGIPLQGAEVGGDRAWATNMSNWAGTINLGVRNGYFLNGVSWIQQDIPNYQPWNIRQGVDVGGVVGTFPDYSYLANGQTSF